jgi:outer membrane receptor for ferrienterochelin and colicins
MNKTYFYQLFSPRQTARKATAISVWSIALASAGFLFGISPMAIAQSGGEDSVGSQPGQLENVTVRARRSFEDRFESTASTVVVNRQDIEAMGASNIADILRQLPGVQVNINANGGVEIRMRGMGTEATRILIDGSPASTTQRGVQLPLEELPADIIERVEVVRSPSAQFEGAAGGSVNIVLRQAQTRRETLAYITFQHAFDKTSPVMFVSQTGPLGTKPPADKKDIAQQANEARWGYFLSLAGGERNLGANTERSSQVIGGPLAGSSVSEDENRIRSRTWTLTPRINGRISATDQITFRGQFSVVDQDASSNSTGTGVSGGQATSFSSNTPWQFNRELALVAADWTHRFKSSRLETTVQLERTSSDYGFQRDTVRTVAGVPSTSNTQFFDDRRERSWAWRNKWTKPSQWGVFTAGSEIEQRTLTVDSTSTTNAVPTALDLGAQIQRNSLWAETEVPFASVKSTVTAGLRAQQYQLESVYVGSVLNNDQFFLQPSINSRTRLGPDTQLRLNLARVTRVPRIWEFLNRTVPTITTNTANSPDFQGNPNLRPESTITFDVGIDQRFKNLGQGGLNMFVRQQSDVIGRRLSLNAGRWIEQTDNVGDALVWGVESDLRGNLAWAGLPRDWTLSANATALFSRITAGDNVGSRISGQARYLANVTIAKPMRLSGGWYGGTTLSMVGSSDLNSPAIPGASVVGREGSHAEWDIYVGHVINKLGFWRLNLFNVTDSIRDSRRVVTDTNGIVYADQSARRFSPRVFFTVGTRL